MILNVQSSLVVLKLQKKNKSIQLYVLFSSHLAVSFEKTDDDSVDLLTDRDQSEYVDDSC